ARAPGCAAYSPAAARGPSRPPRSSPRGPTASGAAPVGTNGREVSTPSEAGCPGTSERGTIASGHGGYPDSSWGQGGYHQLADPTRQRHWLSRVKTGRTALRRRVAAPLGPAVPRPNAAPHRR